MKGRGITMHGRGMEEVSVNHSEYNKGKNTRVRNTAGIHNVREILFTL